MWGDVLEAVRRPFLKSLEGIRAYAFLMVFAVHFSGFKWNLIGRSPAAYPWLIFLQLSFVAVPIFFALSGYLITGVLFDSMDRGGYFRVFYCRRAIRVFPLYYAFVVLAILLALANGGRLRAAHLLYLVYLNNWNPDETFIIWSKYVHVSHLWSMAVEEQYYLLWPVIVWVLRKRNQILMFCYSGIALAFALRLMAPILHLTPFQAYQSSFLRADTLMLGSALALHERGSMQSLARLTTPSWIALVTAGIALSARALSVGQALPSDRFGLAIVTPLLSIMGASMVVLAIQPGNAFSYLCERPWAVLVGKMSYSLYLLHEMLVPIWEMKITPFLSAHLGSVLGRVTGMILAFGIIYGVSCLTYHFIEMPFMNLKEHFKYDKTERNQRYSTLDFLRKITS